MLRAKIEYLPLAAFAVSKPIKKGKIAGMPLTD